MTSKLAAAALALATVAAPAAAQSARVVVINGDPAGIGFNDPTPATPVGGNPGTTVGQQALNVFQTAANRWAANLQSKKLITVIAFFRPLSCTATSAVLGSAAPYFSIRDVPALAEGGQELEPGTFYPVALAEKRTRQEITEALLPNEPFEIFTQFNGRLGQPGCLDGSGWYLGLDNNQPSNRIDLLAVVMHEFGHGLGVTVGPTNSSTGVRGGRTSAVPAGYPSVWERRMLDVTTGKRWIDMTATERAASARNDLNLVWAGPQVTNVVPATLEFQVQLSTPAASSTLVGQASYGPGLSRGAAVTGVLSAPNDGGGPSLRDGCEPYPASANVAGTFVLVDRGICSFVLKTQLAQAAGAAGVIIANNQAGFLSPGGSASGITIPTFGVTQTFGATLRAAAPTSITLVLDSSARQGTTAGYARLFAPPTFQSGSSVSHFDTSLTPSVLMEPNITSDLTTKVKNPFDLTLALLRDIGW